MKRLITILAACACACAWAGVASARLGSLGRNDTVVTNVTDVTPGNYETVSNRAMTASAYTDAALGAFAATGTVARISDGTNTIDASGSVYAAATTTTAWNFTSPVAEISIIEPVRYYAEGSSIASWVEWRGAGWYCFAQYESAEYTTSFSAFMAGEEDSDWLENATDEIYFTRRVAGKMYPVGKLALTNDIPDVSGCATQLQATNAAIAVADERISTNNAAFVSAVLAVPLTGADAGDLAEIAEYGGYGTVGAALLALIAGLAALKRRMATAETALAQKASLADLPYALVTPGEWEFSGLSEDAAGTAMSYDNGYWTLYISYDGETDSATAQGSENDLVVVFSEAGITATRASLPGHLCDRAGNRVVVSGDTTLTLPAAVPGYLRDFLVRLEISGSTVPTITFAAPTGETLTYETDGDEFPVPDEAGTWLYAFTESCVSHKFAVSLKKVNTVAQGGA